MVGRCQGERVSGAELQRRTLTALYNERPTWLAMAHDAIDQAVVAAYGWEADMPDDEMLRHLLDQNLKRSEAWAIRPARADEDR